MDKKKPKVKDTHVLVAFYCPKYLHKALRWEAMTRGETVSDVIRDLLTRRAVKRTA